MASVSERLAQDIGTWLTDGLVSKETHDLLHDRYTARTFGLGQAAKYVGLSGGLLIVFGLLGLVGAMADSAVFAAFLLFAVGAGLTWGGIRLSLDRLGRYGFSSNVVLALGIVAAMLGLGVGVHSVVRDENETLFITGLLGLPMCFGLAYRFGNTFVLILGVLGSFHWVGSSTAMLGRSTYGMSIQDPRVMAIAALCGLGCGLYHERFLREKTGRFFLAYEAISLVYLNLLLLTLSIDGGHGTRLVWVVLLFVAALGQILAGARLPNGLLTGFGVTAFALNLYTRYFEHFWDRTHEGVFFLAGGLTLFALGFGCEVLLRRHRHRGNHP